MNPTFTATPPTKPGNFRWRQTDASRPILVEVVECPETGGLRAYSSEHQGDFVTHPLFGGLWCRLVTAEGMVPKEEVEKAYKEGFITAERSAANDWHLEVDPAWQNSNAKEGLQ